MGSPFIKKKLFYNFYPQEMGHDWDPTNLFFLSVVLSWCVRSAERSFQYRFLGMSIGQRRRDIPCCNCCLGCVKWSRVYRGLKIILFVPIDRCSRYNIILEYFLVLCCIIYIMVNLNRKYQNAKFPTIWYVCSLINWCRIPEGRCNFTVTKWAFFRPEGS